MIVDFRYFPVESRVHQLNPSGSPETTEETPAKDDSFSTGLRNTHLPVLHLILFKYRQDYYVLLLLSIVYNVNQHVHFPMYADIRICILFIYCSFILIY